MTSKRASLTYLIEHASSSPNTQHGYPSFIDQEKDTGTNQPNQSPTRTSRDTSIQETSRITSLYILMTSTLDRIQQAYRPTSLELESRITKQLWNRIETTTRNLKTVMEHPNNKSTNRKARLLVRLAKNATEMSHLTELSPQLSNKYTDLKEQTFNVLQAMQRRYTLHPQIQMDMNNIWQAARHEEIHGLPNEWEDPDLHPMEIDMDHDEHDEPPRKRPKIPDEAMICCYLLIWY
ncbi:hypothetical protein Pmani_002609 [Petrolisthes manimaculis]|uniref:Uncharacterized protein n=1 Tax=Petrolisthes manimaculis TaxID=1843537 RepID=A0AAE1QHP2_9EUCA|nr:hypothetical protein Pmani_002609 [Petrolisthes manimaculis]